jgi:hypothetical protein
MVKKKSVAATASATASVARPKISVAAIKKAAPETSAATAKDAPGDWPASTMLKRDEKKARSLGLILDEEGNVILPGSTLRPNPPVGFTVINVRCVLVSWTISTSTRVSSASFALVRDPALAIDSKLYSPPCDFYHSL